MPSTFHHTTLDNGLTIIAEADPAAHSAAIGFFVRAGARDEPSPLMGVSHFLEHMVFKGTDTRSAEQVDRAFDDLGANHNAFTTSELTAYHAHCLPEHLPTAHDVLADIMRPALRQRDFDDEKQVILEEIAMYDDQPFFVLYERMMEQYYADHPLRHRVLGTPDSINAMERDAMADYFDHHYSADNTTVALAGRIDFDDMVARIADVCGTWRRTDVERRHAAHAPTPSAFTARSAKVHRHYIMSMCPGPSMQDDRRYAAGMLAQILGDVDGSRLYWALVDRGLAEHAQAFCDSRDGTGELILYACCEPDDAEQVRQIIADESDKLIDSATDDDLARVRSRVATGETLAGELSVGRMKRIGQQWTYLGTYRTLEDELALINKVTLDDIRAVHEAFPITMMVTGELTPA